MNKKNLSERDICTKFINPAIQKAGWNMRTQVREEVSFTDGRIIVQGNLHTRGKSKRADYILYYKSNIPIAIIKAKDNKKAIVEKINALMALCDALEQEVQQSQQHSEMMMQSVLKEVFEDGKEVEV
ncbi:type I restriction enzyme R subunit [Nonlabens xylanidelens]|uniref:Type I restriction enzyme R subunit n=1 Tax=Nonlabens xylanidelens TaxID=191564 RepID=A0A2S6IFJ0_9FLAO|nr:hypothetical protein [Nonlabens xylanidelens]PPK92978.1 type I restriction enzyme R subunit [Nonlabens xylanidelens]